MSYGTPNIRQCFDTIELINKVNCILKYFGVWEGGGGWKNKVYPIATRIDMFTQIMIHYEGSRFLVTVYNDINVKHLDTTEWGCWFIELWVVCLMAFSSCKAIHATVDLLFEHSGLHAKVKLKTYGVKYTIVCPSIIAESSTCFIYFFIYT